METSTYLMQPSALNPVRACEELPVESPSATQDISISLYENGIPLSVEAEIDQLYESLFSSSAMFKACGAMTDVCVYVARKGDQAKAIFVFRYTQGRVDVLNEQIRIDKEEMRQFTSYIFGKYANVQRIYFRAIQTESQDFKYPLQRAKSTNDAVLSLPNSAPDYLASIGKSTRENIKRYLKLLKRDIPSVTFEVHDNNVSEEILRSILNLSHARMASKNKVSGINGQEEKRIFFLTRECGIVTTVSIDGNICAGTILFRVGNNYYLRVIAHDPAYSDYRLGLLCCYLSICECIERKGRNYHFLWGREIYKYRLLGKHQDFDSITIYRSRIHFILDGKAVLTLAAKAHLNNVKHWLTAPANQDRLIARMAHSTRNFLKSVRNQSAMEKNPASDS